MLVIRDKQLEAFEAAGMLQFERKMAEHIGAYAPELARVAGASGLQAAAHAGIVRAASYGFTNKGPVRLFVEMLCSLGSDFDTDPQYPWAREILTAPGDQGRRASLLHRASVAYFENVAGPGDAYAYAALRKVFQTDWLAVSPSASLTERILAAYEACYPQKYAHVQEPGLRSLVARAFELADEHGLPADWHRALIAAVLFSFGHGALSDPLYPWIGGALSDARVRDAEGHAKRLHTRLHVYVDEILRTAS